MIDLFIGSFHEPKEEIPIYNTNQNSPHVFNSFPVPIDTDLKHWQSSQKEALPTSFITSRISNGFLSRFGTNPPTWSCWNLDFEGSQIQGYWGVIPRLLPGKPYDNQ